MGKVSPWVKWRQNRDADAAALSEFLSKGGKVVKLRNDENDKYDENLKKIQKTLIGGFSPFTKEESLLDTSEDSEE